MPSSFYVRDGTLFVPTVLTRGPWDEESQHGGPPAALVATALEQLAEAEAGGPLVTARVTVELHKPVPIAPLRLVASLSRTGRTVVQAHGALVSGDTEVLRATSLLLRPSAAPLPARGQVAPPDPPSAARPVDFFPVPWTEGYHTATEWRFLSGSFTEPGPGVAWARMRVPLVEGEPVRPLARVLLVADAGNGVSSELDLRRYLFINPDLTLYLHRMPRGEWVCLDGRTVIEPNGVGLAQAALYDELGPLGRSLQSLTIRPRPG